MQASKHNQTGKQNDITSHHHDQRTSNLLKRWRPLQARLDARFKTANPKELITQLPQSSIHP